jgi:hypothetical protein
MPVGAIVGASVIGAGASIIGSSNAADAQTAAADKASAQQAAQYAQTRSDLLPYNTAGQGALNALSYGLGTSSPTTATAGTAATPDYNAYLAANPDVQAAYGSANKASLSQYYGINSPQEYAAYHYNTYGKNEGRTLPTTGGTAATTTAAPGASSGIAFGSLSKPVSMTEADVQATPGFQFNLNQGLKAVQNSAASRGLGVSGAALKGAASYATGLADSTYQNQFNNAVTNQNNTYNRLLGVANLGENAGATTGALGTQTATNIGNNTIGAGNALAASSNAIGNTISGATSPGSLYLTNALLKSAGGSGIFGSGANDAAYNNGFSNPYGTGV